MKKTLSMLLAICMLAALVALPASAEATTETVKVSTTLDLSAFEAGTLTSEMLSGNSILKYAGVGETADVKYTKADGSEATLKNQNPLNFDASVSSNESGTSTVEIAEHEGENVIVVKSNTSEPAGIAFAPIAEGAFADGKKVRVGFEFMQPSDIFVGKIALGLAIDNGEGLDYLEINKPTDVSIDDIEEGSTADTRFLNNTEVGYASLTYNEKGVASPALYYSRTNSKGQYTGPNSWAMVVANDANNTTYPHTVEGRKAAMDSWLKVSYEMTLQSNGIMVRIYQNHKDATVLQFTEYLYPMTEEELANFDGKLCVVLSGFTPYASYQNDDGGEFYVRNVCQYLDTEVNAPVYESKTIYNNGFEDMKLGTVPRNNGIFVGANSGLKYINTSYDNRLDENNGPRVVLNPATDAGNETGKVLAVLQEGSEQNGAFGFRTGVFSGASLQSEEGVTFETDFLPMDGYFDNGRLALYRSNADGTAAGGDNGDAPNSNFFVGHWQYRRLSMQGSSGITWGVEASNTNDWYRYFVNFKADNAGKVTATWYMKNLHTGEVTETKSAVNNNVMDMTSDYAISLTFSYPHSGKGYYYFDNIAVKGPEQVINTKIYSAESEYGVYASSSEIYVELAAGAENMEELEKAVTLKNAAGDTLSVNVDVSVDNLVQKVTITPTDDFEGMEEDAIYTIGFGGQKYTTGKVIEDVKFKAGSDWNGYDPSTPASVSTDMNDEVKIGDVITITVADDTFGTYAATDYIVTTSNENVLDIDYENGVWTASVVGAGNAEIIVKSYLAPAEPDMKVKVSCEGILTKYDVVFVDGDKTYDAITVGEGYGVTAPEPIGGSDTKMFARWATDETGETRANLKSITNDSTFYAIYSEMVTVSFVSSDEELGSVSESSETVAKGYGLETIPTTTAKGHGVFAYWKDSKGNRYTNDELKALTFDAAETITAVFVKDIAEIDHVYDFTKMTKDDIQDASKAIDGLTGGAAVYSEDKGLTFNTTSTIRMKFDGISEGKYVLDVDYYKEQGSANKNIEMTTTNGKKLQGVYLEDTLYTQAANGVPSMVKNLQSSNDTFHNVKLYMDFDNGTYYVVHDGIAGVPQYGELLNEKNLNVIQFWIQPKLYYQRIALKKVDSLELSTITVNQDEVSSAIVGAGTFTTATIPTNTKIQIKYALPEGYTFKNWTVEGATVQDAAAAETFITPTAATVTVTPEAEASKYAVSFVAGDYATFTDDTASYANQEIAWGEKLTNIPKLSVESGYEFIGWTTDGETYVQDTEILETEVKTAYKYTAVVKKSVATSVTVDSVQAQVGQTIKVPVNVTVSEEIKGGTATITYDSTLFEYVGAEVNEELETKLYVKKVSNGKLQVVINTTDSVSLKGLLANLKFKALKKAENAELGVELSFDYNTEADVKVTATSNIGKINVSILKGDVNLDGKIDVYDAIAVLNHISGVSPLTGDALVAADVVTTNDADITVSDATTILKYIARIILSF